MWYIVLSRSLPEKEESKQQNYEEHRQWLDDQHRAGRLLFSGPTADRAYGIYIMLASSKSEAEALAAQDPHHVRGIRTIEVLEWNPHRAFRLDGATIADIERMSSGNSNFS
ncbi:MAG: YciI family protein [Nitrososphaerales archaeon]